MTDSLPQEQTASLPPWKENSIRSAPPLPVTPMPYSRPPIVLFAAIGLFLVLASAAGAYLLLGSELRIPELPVAFPNDDSIPQSPSPADTTVFSQGINTALDIRKKTEVDGIVTAVKLYYAENGKYPGGLEEIISSQLVPANQNETEDKNSNTQSDYSYELRENETNCVVKALLTTGEEYIRYCKNTSEDEY